jgi:hypothetical protein
VFEERERRILKSKATEMEKDVKNIFLCEDGVSDG